MTQATKILKLQNDRIGVVTPYHPEAVKRFKALMGVWGSVKDHGNAWLLAAEHQPKVEQIISELWPEPDQLQEIVITFDSGDGKIGQAPIIDGLEVCRFERDRRGRIDHPSVVEVIEDTLRTGGSRNHPTIGGRLVVRARVRAGANVEWKSQYASDSEPEVVIETSGDAADVVNNPLARFATEDLLAELRSRSVID